MPTLAPSRFVAVQGFPAPGEQVTEIVAGGPGFVAVGFADNPTPECPYSRDGRIWTSADGERWARRDGDSLADTYLGGVVVSGAALYAFGYVGVPGDCPVSDGFGNNVWRSTDGITWQQLTSGIGDENDAWNDVAASGNTLVAVGRFGFTDDDVLHGGVWTSTNGVDWQVASRPPATYDLVTVAALGGTVVAFGEDIADGPAWYSQDGGDTWQAGRIDSGYVPYSFDLIAAHDRFVLVTSSCCGVPMRTVGVALTSTDGRTWSTGSAPEAHFYHAEQVVSVPGAFVALSPAGETRLSSDGVSWRSGPAGPHLDQDTGFIQAAGAGSTGVVMVTNQSAAGGGREVRAWFAPLREFSPGSWTQPAVAAHDPVVGQSYAYRLYTHCGEEGTRVLMDGGIWLVDRVESTGRGFANPEDRGTIILLDQNRARYESRRGGSILFERAADPPPWPRCA